MIQIPQNLQNHAINDLDRACFLTCNQLTGYTTVDLATKLWSFVEYSLHLTWYLSWIADRSCGVYNWPF